MNKGSFYSHILQNAHVTSNKMVHKKLHHFLAQFSVPFHIVCSVLLRLFAQVSKRCIEVWKVAKKALRWNVLFLIDAHAVLFTVRIWGASSYETRRANGTASILVIFCFKNHWIEASDWLSVKELQPARRWFSELILATKRITPCERVLKTVLNGVFSCVPFSLRSLGRFERCAPQRSRRTDLIFHYPLKWNGSISVLISFLFSMTPCTVGFLGGCHCLFWLFGREGANLLLDWASITFST